MTCHAPAAPVQLGVPPDGYLVDQSGTSIAITQDPENPVSGSAVVPITGGLNLEEPVVFSWVIQAIAGVAAFGLSFGTTGIIGPGLVNLYYLSDGQLVQNGVATMGVPQLVVGDELQLWYDPANQTAVYLLNGQRVA